MPWASVLTVGTVLAALFGANFLRGWLRKRQQAGRISGRRAGWIYAAAAFAPYLVLFSYLGIQNPSSIWASLAVGFLIYSIQILPWVAAFRYPEDERRKRQL
jgi:hypothetical protein